MRGARHRACPGTVSASEETSTPCQVRLARPPSRSSVSSLRPTRVGRGARELDRWGFRLVGLRLDRRGLGDPPGLHGRPTGWNRRPLQESGTLPSCASHARRTRLAPCSSSSSSFRPDLRITPWVLPCRARCSSPEGSPRRHPSGWPYDRLVRVSKDRPSTVSRAEESTSRGHVAVTASETGRQPASCTAFVVLHHPGGLLLPDPARVLHRASSPGVRDVSSPRQRIPTTRSCPSKLCSLRVAGCRRITPGQPGHVTLSDPPRGTPWTLPPRPWGYASLPSASSR